MSRLLFFAVSALLAHASTAMAEVQVSDIFDSMLAKSGLKLNKEEEDAFRQRFIESSKNKPEKFFNNEVALYNLFQREQPLIYASYVEELKQKNLTWVPAMDSRFSNLSVSQSSALFGLKQPELSDADLAELEKLVNRKVKDQDDDNSEDSEGDDNPSPLHEIDDEGFLNLTEEEREALLEKLREMEFSLEFQLPILLQLKWGPESNDLHPVLKYLIGRTESFVTNGKYDLPDEAARSLPKEYNAAAEYPECPTISTIPDQQHCGSCWAVTAASVLSDRLCIATKGKFQSPISAEFMSNCYSRNGCMGGLVEAAFLMFHKVGAPTGGKEANGTTCYPYGNYPTLPDGINHQSAVCTDHCTDHSYRGDEMLDAVHNVFLARTRPFEAELIKNEVASIRRLTDIDSIKYEIITRGPVAAAFFVSRDIFAYRSGIYVPQERFPLQSGHAVRIIGWGEEDGIPYWMIANSWGSGFGSGGFIKYAMGYSGIEHKVLAMDVVAGYLPPQQRVVLPPTAPRPLDNFQEVSSEDFPEEATGGWSPATDSEEPEDSLDQPDEALASPVPSESSASERIDWHDLLPDLADIIRFKVGAEELKALRVEELQE